MCNSGDIKRKNIVFEICLVLVFCTIHLLIVPDFGDDIKFVKIMERYDYNIFQVLYHRYNTWSSRIFIEFFDFIIPCLPVYIWKVSDIIICLLLWKMSAIYIEDKYISGLCLLAYPFFHMGSAGWQVTTIVYLWTFVVWLSVISSINSYKKSFIWVIFGTALATNLEILAVIHILALGMWFFYLIYLQDGRLVFESCKSIKNELSNNIILKKIMVSLVVTLLNLLNALACPGNSLRKIKGIEKNFPDFLDTSFIEKLRICIASTVEHFTSLPDIIFIIISVLAAFLCYQRMKGFRKYIGFIPCVICIGLTVYFLVTRVIGQHTTSYMRPDVNAVAGSTEYILQCVMMAIGIIYLVTMLWTLAYCCDGIKECYFIIGVYCTGLLGRFVLLFSPTMIASGTRVYFYFYMAMIVCIGQLISKIKSEKIKKLFIVLLLIGVAVNVVTIAVKGH